VFSSRTHWDRSPNPLARALEHKRASGARITDLTESNPTRCGFAYPEAAILGALSSPLSLRYQPDPRGLLEARASIVHYYEDLGATVSADRIVLTASTSEAYSFVFRLLADPGDEVIVPAPSYPLFDFLTELDSVKTRTYALRYDGGWHVDLASVRAALTSRTRAIVLIHPHNPTGAFLKADEVSALDEIAAGAGAALVCDEVFADYAVGADISRCATTAGERHALTFTLSGLSKVAGLPQLKLGWIAVSGQSDIRDEALERLEIIADSYLSVNTPAQLALRALLAQRRTIQEQIRARIIANRTTLAHASAGKAWQVLPAEGGWYALIRMPRRETEEEWVLRLLEDGNVLVHPGFFFDFADESLLVVSLLPPAADVAGGAEAIDQMVR
jgi:aspartate/methionine/tyrosine aminotransferase